MKKNVLYLPLTAVLLAVIVLIAAVPFYASEAAPEEDTGVTSVKQLAAALGEDKVSVSGSTVKLTDNIDMSSTVYITSGNYILDLNGWYLRSNEIFTLLFSLAKGTGMKIRDTSKNQLGSLAGYLGTGMILNVEKGATLILESGQITCGMSAITVGGSFVQNGGRIIGGLNCIDLVGGSFELNDGSINAGITAVVVTTGSKFIMRGGEISGVNSVTCSSGICKLFAGTLTGKSVIKIQGSADVSLLGATIDGSVYALNISGGTTTVSAGEISGDSFGVYMNGGTLKLSGKSGKTAKISGGSQSYSGSEESVVEICADTKVTSDGTVYKSGETIPNPNKAEIVINSTDNTPEKPDPESTSADTDFETLAPDTTSAITTKAPVTTKPYPSFTTAPGKVTTPEEDTKAPVTDAKTDEEGKPVTDTQTDNNGKPVSGTQTDNNGNPVTDIQTDKNTEDVTTPETGEDNPSTGTSEPEQSEPEETDINNRTSQLTNNINNSGLSAQNGTFKVIFIILSALAVLALLGLAILLIIKKKRNEL